MQQQVSLTIPWRRIWLSEKREVYCLVDAVDYEWLMTWRWNIGWHAKTKWKFYAKRNVGAARLTVYMAREILMRATGCTSDYAACHVGHHINAQSLDNRRDNLGWTTKEENSSIRVKRGEAPTLESIEARLMKEAGLKMVGVPF